MLLEQQMAKLNEDGMGRAGQPESGDDDAKSCMGLTRCVRGHHQEEGALGLSFEIRCWPFSLQREEEHQILASVYMTEVMCEMMNEDPAAGVIPAQWGGHDFSVWLNGLPAPDVYGLP